MPIFDRACQYIETAASLQDKITKIDDVIRGLMVAMASAADGAHIDEYELNDGQTRIRTRYRSPEAIQSSIAAFERLKQLYVNKLDGRVVRLMDSSNFIRQ